MMFPRCLQKHFYLIILIIFVVSFGNVRCSAARDDEDRRVEELKERRYIEAVELATNTYLSFLSLFDDCLQTTMIHQPFSVYNMRNFVMNPPRTTVGFVPKFTSQRKFFANMLATTKFREMLHRDSEVLRIKHVQKMKYCDNAVMDANLLKDFYDREVDQSKV